MGEDIIWALQSLGFDCYVEPLKVYMARYREVRRCRDPAPVPHHARADARAHNGQMLPPRTGRGERDDADAGGQVDAPHELAPHDAMLPPTL
jgi:hypothetical protein